ncbi:MULTISPECIES: M15 family metallopeptidase [unclassified Isoptericola]|uniref:M15 family metallopeptidase n=1 Tax=unclassified Isoptericola TaxID=2623355 RepID=UPI00365AA73A
MSPRVLVTVLHRFCAASVAGAVAALGVVVPAAVAGAAIPVPRPDDAMVLTRAWTPVDDPADPLVLVNKSRPISPRGWAPDDLVKPDVPALGGHDRMRPRAARALERLAAAADDATGRTLVLASAFRSMPDQRRLYARYVAGHGSDDADTFSARPGFSEHQTGLAVDVAQQGTSYLRFGRTETGRWVARNAWRYGFVVRYPKGAADVTGYSAEPWHLRYVGPALTTRMHLAGITTLEEAFGVASAPDYGR